MQSGYCILGCSYDAKQSMLVTYVPRAERLGARVYANARVEQIEALRRRAAWRAVHGRVVDALGRDGHPGARFAWRRRSSCSPPAPWPRRISCCAAASRTATGQVGEHLHLHPSAMVAGFFDEPIHAYRGIPQSYYIDEFIDLARDPHAGYVLMPIAGFPVLTAAQLPGFGREQFRYMRASPAWRGSWRCSTTRARGACAPGTRPRGRASATRSTPRDRAQLAEGLLHCVEVLLAGGRAGGARALRAGPARSCAPATTCAPILRRGVAQSGRNAIPLASTHPQSTCRMGGDPRAPSSARIGECHEVAGLFVADMGVFPTSLGAPPQITTAALADRTAHHILERRAELGV